MYARPEEPKNSNIPDATQSGRARIGAQIARPLHSPSRFTKAGDGTGQIRGFFSTLRGKTWQSRVKGKKPPMGEP